MQCFLTKNYVSLCFTAFCRLMDNETFCEMLK